MKNAPEIPSQNNPVVVGLEIGASKIAVAVGEFKPDRVLNIRWIGTVPSCGMSNGEIVDFDSTKMCVRQALADAEKMTGMKIEIVNLAITGPDICSFNSRVGSSRIFVGKRTGSSDGGYAPPSPAPLAAAGVRGGGFRICDLLKVPPKGGLTPAHEPAHPAWGGRRPADRFPLVAQTCAQRLLSTHLKQRRGDLFARSAKPNLQGYAQPGVRLRGGVAVGAGHGGGRHGGIWVFDKLAAGWFSGLQARRDIRYDDEQEL